MAAVVTLIVGVAMIWSCLGIWRAGENRLHVGRSILLQCGIAFGAFVLLFGSCYSMALMSGDFGR